ncbi:MAG TPA: AMP-binding protein, partial [Gemmatimonadaceae bacterium]|nr:AMP-binding protein [Gemmatimonadaceae bacterium]
EYWLRLSERSARFAGVTLDDVALTAQPFYYMDPQWNVGMCLVAGCPLVILPRFSASTFWRSVQETGTTFFYVLGTMPVFLLKQPPDPTVERGHRVRFVSCSGIVPALHAEFEARWGVPWREAFGMTETGVDLFVPVEDTACVGSGAAGRPVEGEEACVVDPAGHPLGDGEVGELCVRGSGMMLGYWNNPAATAERIRDGWLHTGDLAWRDEQGYYHIVGRLKDMIRRTGENISAVEVEGVLAQHPAVRGVAVVPVADELRGEEVKAFVQLQPGHEETPPQALVDFARANLAAFKVPRFIEYVDDLPRTPSEKVAKHVLLARTGDQRRGAWDATTGTRG